MSNKEKSYLVNFENLHLLFIPFITYLFIISFISYLLIISFIIYLLIISFINFHIFGLYPIHVIDLELI